jgi:hypothetical protein
MCLISGKNPGIFLEVTGLKSHRYTKGLIEQHKYSITLFLAVTDLQNHFLFFLNSGLDS